MFDAARYPVVVFDFDGTIADTGAAIKRFASETVAAAGIGPATDEQLCQMIGPPLVEGFQIAFGVSPEQSRALTADYRARMDGAVTPADYPAFPGVRELLDDLHAQGRRVAVATSRREGSALDMIHGLGLEGSFDAVAGGLDGVRDTKADSIREALARLGCRPGDAVMVGDRFHDVEGAHEVGLPCIGIYSGTAIPGELEAAGADAVVHGVTELRALLE